MDNNSSSLLVGLFSCYLNEGLGQDNNEGIDEAEEKPNLNILDRSSGGEATGDGDVESRENHQGSEIDLDDVTAKYGSFEVVSGLVDDVHQNGG